MASSNHIVQVVYRAWCAKNSLPKPVELKNQYHLALWKTTYATLGVYGQKIVSASFSITQRGANSAFLDLEKSTQLQLNDTMTATMIKRFQSAEASTSLAFHCPEPSLTVSVVIEPEFVKKCNESQHVLHVVLALDNGEIATTDIAMQIYSKHSGTRSKLLLNPKEKHSSSSPRKNNNNARKSPKKNSRTTRSVTVSDPAQKRRFLTSKKNTSVSDESDSEYNDSSDEEYAIQPAKATKTRAPRGRRVASVLKKNNKGTATSKAMQVEDDEKSGESSSDESVSCSNQANSPQTRGDEEIAGSNDRGFINAQDLARDDRDYLGLGMDHVYMDLEDLYYGLHESHLTL